MDGPLPSAHDALITRIARLALVLRVPRFAGLDQETLKDLRTRKPPGEGLPETN